MRPARSAPEPAEGAGPLAGVRVADLSRVLAGPYATMLLADMGADVVKIEHPGRGDDTRAWGPPWVGGEASYFLSVNRGKRSLAADLKDPEVRTAVQEVCAGADVVVQNFRPGVAERLGLGYGDVSARNPAAVYCSISGFGPEHEPARRPGFDLIVQAESGFMAATGEPGGPPTKAGVAITDVLTGLNAAVSVLGALVRARATGRGEHISVSLINSALSGLANVTQQALVTGEEPERAGNTHGSIVPYQAFPTADSDIVVAAGNDALYRRLCEVLGRGDLAADPRFATNPDRVAHRAELVAEITAELRRRPAADWLERLLEAGVPVGRVRGVLDALRSAQQAGDDVLLHADHPAAGPLELVRAGFRMGSAASGGERATTAPPLLGEHSAAVLGEFGVGADRIARLVERGTVHQAQRRDGESAHAPPSD
ncbi:CaiB/BaiF CoA transferase family protein [Streptomonospora litoralis]|uniref:Succinyl-CoA:(R)-benzylsuccinate CoA-transferase subunit BbsF n=1 Tax=Streptomonospora litoralis TaxID=2498135 RepID=A0A4P6Q055_9ACTN|nr:CoA transferase [Streptomonospora litoralis]QBI53845.1 Succinyl-CoA:(R)-benzylsuccinate CoA-transferase subunit BbsF [Streptomonospora litoralis]